MRRFTHMKPLPTVRADSIREGDQFIDDEVGRPIWTAVSNAYETGDNAGNPVVAINVQHHPDGGLDSRWFPLDMEWPKRLIRRRVFTDN
jgi:hypothetical protein